MAGIYEKRCRRASLILVMIDDFTDRNITDSALSIQADNGQRPIKKENGVYIFINMPQGSAGICVEGFYYRKKRIEVFVKEGQEGVICPVRMTPNRQYPIPADTCCLEGRAEPGQMLKFYRRNEPKPWKLLKNYEQEAFIEIFTGGPAAEYRVLYLEEKGERGEFFETKEADGQKYRLESPLTSAYKKIGTKIYPVYSVTADEQGEFFLPIAGAFTGETELCCYVGEGTKKIVSVEAGKRNRLELLV